jgi:FdhD protein
MMKDFDDQSRNLRKSGSFQYAAAFLDAKLRAFFEDVGLNNAVDKTLGAVLKMQIDPSRTVLLSSGRLSAVEVLKAARIRIPVIVSLRGPVYSGVRAAEKTGVALCSFAGGSWMNVYAGFDRIIFGL